MGKEAKTKSDRRHLKKLFNGRHTAEEVHQQVAWGGARCLCGGAAAIRIRLFSDARELLPGGKLEALGAQMAFANGGQVPCVDFKGASGQPVKHVRISDVYACKRCQTTAERSAAHPPHGWPELVVEIDRGPGPDKPIVAVG